ncbi:MAG: DUF362 domain-containing protein [Dehalococcoidia bacterium]|nr:DUF362 domain-containing protein [Dehalococcoidia bacterium]
MPAQNQSERPKVAVIYTTPATVLEDIATLMELAGFRQHLPQDKETILKVNISWQHFFPACSTTPWQLEGVIKALQAGGYRDLMLAHNKTVVVDAHVGEINNRHKVVADKYGIPSRYLFEPPVKWFRYEPKEPLLVLDKVFPDGIHFPDLLLGRNIVHLPTMKTHVFTTMTGAMKNAFGGLLNDNRHWTHSVIHETLVDLLTIQKDIHPGIFAVMDGTFAGDGPGPRAMRPHVKNVLLASADQVAIDAIAAKMMGFDPLSLDFIRLAHEKGLGCGDPSRIEVAGADVSGVNWHFDGSQDTLASRGQKMIYHGPLKPMENFLLRSPIAPWSFLASNLYFNQYWYRFIGKRRVEQALRTEWGKLFLSY